MVGDYLVLEKGIKTDKIPKELNCIGLYFKELYLCLINQGYTKGRFRT